MSQQHQGQPTSGQHGQHGRMEQPQHERGQRGQAMRSQGGGGSQSRMQQPQTQQQPPMQPGGMQSGGMQQTGGMQQSGDMQESGGTQQPGTQSHQMQGGTPRQQQFEDHLTNELRIALEDFNDVSHVAEWCAKECTRSGPQMATCARICTDIAELAELNERWIARDSMFGPDIAEQFVQIATEALPELEQHQQTHPHVGETIGAIERALESCRTVLEMAGGQQGTMGRETPQPAGGRMGGGPQPTGGQQF